MAGKLKMSASLKKLIIGMVAFVVLAVIAVVVFSVLSGLTQTTIYDIRIVYADTLNSENPTEVFDKQVYLTKENENYFNIAVQTTASSLVANEVYSTNTDVASVSYVNNAFRVSYHSAGTAEIVAKCAQGGNMYDKFTLTVCQNIPTEFEFGSAIDNYVGDQEINVYADSIEHSYEFTASLNKTEQQVDLNTLYLIEDYNEDIFEYIKIDTSSQTLTNQAKLLIKAKSSTTVSTAQYITVQAKNGDSSVSTFVIKINVLGNYIDTFKFVVSDSPYFAHTQEFAFSAKASDGFYKEGIEPEQFDIYINDGNKFYEVFVKVYVVYTNGREVLVTDKVNRGVSGESKVQLIDNEYIAITPQSADVQFTLEKTDDVDDTIVITRIMTFKIEPSIEDLYTRVEDGGSVYYTYNYFDSRFKWQNVVTDNYGRIVAFLDSNNEAIEYNAQTEE